MCFMHMYFSSLNSDFQSWQYPCGRKARCFGCCAGNKRLDICLVLALACPGFLSQELSASDSDNIWPFASENLVTCVLPCVYIFFLLYFFKECVTSTFPELQLSLFSGWQLHKTFLIRCFGFFLPYFSYT